MELLIWLGFEVVFIVVHLFISLIPISEQVGRVVLSMYSQVFINIMAIWIFHKYLYKLNEKQFLGENFKCNLWSAIIGVGVCLGHRIFFLLFWNFTIQSMEGIMQTGIDSQVVFLNTIWGILYITIMAPVTEEIFYRGIIFNTARKKHGNIYAVIVSSTLFAVAHMNGIQFISALFMGIVIGYAIILTDNIYIGIIIHVVNNTFSLFNTNILNKFWGNEDWQVYLQMTVGIILLVIGIVMLRREKKVVRKG